jgi:pSer/pThr/pTyr-binding forkhead associated (FHA) protein
MRINDRLKALWQRLAPLQAGDSPVQGKDLLAALKSAVHNGRKVFKSGTFVADHYEVRLHEPDHRFLSPILRPLREELLEELNDHIRKKGYQTPSGDITIQIRPDQNLEAGNVRVAGTFRESESTPGESSIVLMIRGESGQTTRFELDAGPHILGRGQGVDLPVAGDLTVSSRHCEFLVEEGRLRVRDLGSANGTIVNGLQIESECELTAGDRLLVGHTEIEVGG